MRDKKKKKEKVEIIIDPKDNMPLIRLDALKPENNIQNWFKFHDLQRNKEVANQDAVLRELKFNFSNQYNPYNFNIKKITKHDNVPSLVNEINEFFKKYGFDFNLYEISPVKKSDNENDDTNENL